MNLYSRSEGVLNHLSGLDNVGVIVPNWKSPQKIKLCLRCAPSKHIVDC